MAYSLQSEDKGDHVHFTVTGTNSFENAMAFLTECASHSIRTGRRRLLIEDRLVGPSLELEQVEALITLLGMVARSAVDAIAYVVPDPRRDRAILRFAENLAALRRINVRAFRDPKEAAWWIREQGRGRGPEPS